jgi:SAM-dependent methyltransferase
MMLNQYESFAAAYDRMMHDCDRERWANYLDMLLKRYDVREVLDCACGTGEMAIRLHKRGYRVLGNDLSPQMLMEARNRAYRDGCGSIIFICEDMRKLKLHRPIDAIVSVCDGVNYLTSATDVDSFFRHAADCLRPGGVLLFDISSRYKFKNVLADNTFTDEADDYAYIWKNMYDPKTALCEMELTGFVRRGDQFDRFHETHLQKAHSADDLRKRLEKAGFCDVQTFTAFTTEPVSATCERIQFVARKGCKYE